MAIAGKPSTAEPIGCAGIDEKEMDDHDVETLCVEGPDAQLLDAESPDARDSALELVRLVLG